MVGMQTTEERMALIRAAAKKFQKNLRITTLK